MKLVSFECKKLYRSAGFRYLCIALLLVNYLFCLFGNINSPDISEQEEYINNYNSNISYVVRVAERNLEEYKATIGNDSYLVRYQQRVIDHYSALIDSGVEPTVISGWNEFFDSKTDDLILLLFAVLAGIIISMTEYDNGTYIILNMTVNGQKSRWAKIVLMSLFSIISVILVFIVSVAGIAIRFGLSAPTASICSVIRFTYCPYDISIIDYLILSGIIKSINMLVIMLLSAMVAVLFRSYLVSFFVSFAYITLGYVASEVQTNSELIFINPYSVGLTDSLWERYRSINIFDQVVPVLAVIGVVLIVSCLLLMYFLQLDLSYGSERLLYSKIEKRISGLYRRCCRIIISGLPRCKPRRRGLLFYEAQKSFIKSHLIILCIIMLFVKIWYTGTVTPESNIPEQYYREVCDSLSGDLTEEKRQHIFEVIEESNNVISKMNSMRNATQNGTITREEYNAYLDEYSKASIKLFAYQKLAVQCDRIDIASERGQPAYIIYDSGWLYLFTQKADVLLYAFLLLFFCGIYDMEYKNRFDRVAETTARGMRALHKSKSILVVSVTMFTFLLFSAVDSFYILQVFTLPHADFTISSIMIRSFSLPLWCVAIMQYLIKMVLAAIFSLSVCLTSRFLKKVYLTIPAGIILMIAFFNISCFP